MAEDRDGEEDDDLALGLLVRLRVVVAQAVVVLRVARVLEPVGQACPSLAWVTSESVGRGLVGRVVVAHEDFAPIQTAAPMSRPMPTTQAHEALADRAEGAEGRGRPGTRRPAGR